MLTILRQIILKVTKMNALTIHERHFDGVVTRRSASAWVPELVAAAGPRATDAYIEFFTATSGIGIPGWLMHGPVISSFIGARKTG